MKPDLIDRRQRQAACLLLGAIELPAPAELVAKAWIAAAAVCPGIAVEHALLSSRRAMLESAQAIIAELLAELAVPRGGAHG